MRAVILCVLLLAVLSASTEVQGDMKVVKLCGREFIRAVIYTCGGSRWRRLLDEQDLTGVGSEAVLPSGNGIPECSDPQAYNSQRQGTDSEEPLNYRTQAEGELSPRARRDLNQLLTTACCQWGCNKKDLSSLC
ncbi:insulin-like 5a [Huso huso]|uniref:Insulin-like 5a n=1 Tax=Huso huso TaxID=61971 RepID=A0ABR0ZIL4_HUSHU